MTMIHENQLPPFYDTATEKVDHPRHYEQYRLETIDAIQGQSTPDEYRGFLKGNIMKYLARYRSKNGVEDLNKAEWYLRRLQEFEALQGDNDGVN